MVIWLLACSINLTREDLGYSLMSCVCVIDGIFLKYWCYISIDQQLYFFIFVTFTFFLFNKCFFFDHWSPSLVYFIYMSEDHSENSILLLLRIINPLPCQESMKADFSPLLTQMSETKNFIDWKFNPSEYKNVDEKKVQLFSSSSSLFIDDSYQISSNY